MGLKIQRVDLNKTGKSVTITFEQSAASRAGDIVNSDNKITVHKSPHDDLKNAFSRLVPHLMFATQLRKVHTFAPEYFENFTYLDEEEFDGINVTGLMISGKDRNMVKIIGTKTTDKLEVISIISPNIFLDDNIDKKYPLVELLRTHSSKAMDEAEKFFGGKYQPDDQLELQM